MQLMAVFWELSLLLAVTVIEIIGCMFFDTHCTKFLLAVYLTIAIRTTKSRNDFYFSSGEFFRFDDHFFDTAHVSSRIFLTIVLKIV